MWSCQEVAALRSLSDTPKLTLDCQTAGEGGSKEWSNVVEAKDAALQPCKDG